MKAHEERFKTSSRILDELISSQKPAKDNDDLGLDEGQSSRTNLVFNKVDLIKRNFKEILIKTRIKGTLPEGFPSESLMLKGTPLLMAFVSHVINLDIKQKNEEVG